MWCNKHCFQTICYDFVVPTLIWFRFESTSSTRYTSKTKVRDEPKTFMLELIGRKTSSLIESLRSIKVDERKCKDEIRVSSLFSASCFTMKASRATFATDVAVHGVRIVPWEHCIKLLPTILYLPTLTSQWTPLGFEIDS